METKEEEWLRFIDTLSHELKTPLTSIIAAAGLLEEELQKTADETHRRLMQTIIRNANSLESRLTELLNIVKTGSGKLQLQFEPVDIKSLILGTCMQISPLMQNKGQKLNTELPDFIPIIQADGQRLEQVLLNLMNNATKFTPYGGVITVRVKKQDTGLVVEVADNGIGIPKDQQDRLFKPYSRVNADRQKHPGLGLGLALSKQVVEMHGGKIWLDSDVGKGAVFSFFLPKRPTASTLI
jgi:signal transduction histidine kinase